MARSRKPVKPISPVVNPLEGIGNEESKEAPEVVSKAPPAPSDKESKEAPKVAMSKSGYVCPKGKSISFAGKVWAEALPEGVVDGLRKKAVLETLIKKGLVVKG